MWIYRQKPGEPEKLERSCVKLASLPSEHAAAIPWSTINGTDTETWTNAKNTTAAASPKRFFSIVNARVAIGVYVYVLLSPGSFEMGI